MTRAELRAFYSIPAALLKMAPIMRMKRAAGQIVKEIIDHMTLKVLAVGKDWEPNALNEWRAALTISVMQKLLDGGDWNADRSKVLEVAGDMAIIAAMLSFDLPKIAKNKVHGAFRAVKEHQACPNPPGSGAWCNFDI